MRSLPQNTASIRLRSTRANRVSGLLPDPTTQPLLASRDLRGGAPLAQPLCLEREVASVEPPGQARHQRTEHAREPKRQPRLQLRHLPGCRRQLWLSDPCPTPDAGMSTVMLKWVMARSCASLADGKGANRNYPGPLGAQDVDQGIPDGPVTASDGQHELFGRDLILQHEPARYPC